MCDFIINVYSIYRSHPFSFRIGADVLHMGRSMIPVGTLTNSRPHGRDSAWNPQYVEGLGAPKVLMVIVARNLEVFSPLGLLSTKLLQLGWVKRWIQLVNGQFKGVVKHARNKVSQQLVALL